MSEGQDYKVAIRHNAGSKANMIEVFPVDGPFEVRIGRDQSCQISYEQGGGDVVSRLHAAIRSGGKGALSFTIADLGSSNGTYLNKKKIQAAAELFPLDVVSLGQNGPSFTFDIDPRPANLAARTRLIEAAPPAATTVIDAAEAATVAATAAGFRAGTRSTTISVVEDDLPSLPTKVGIGRETMLHEIAKERGATNQKWVGAMTGLGVVALIGGGFLYWKQTRNEQAQQLAMVAANKITEQAIQAAEQVKKDAEAAGAETAASIRRQFGMSSLDIVRKYGLSTAVLEAQWRLYDQNTGRPIFHKAWTQDGKKYPLYVKFANGRIAPWFTLDDENRNNRPIAGRIGGTAFVVSEQGFLLTNKHLAAAWRTPFYDDDPFGRYGWLAEKIGTHGRIKWTEINLDDDEYSGLKKWTPDQGGFIFDNKNLRIVGDGRFPDLNSNQQRDFVGRNESLTIKFAKNRLEINASLVRYSNENDAALIKIDSLQNLTKVDIDEDPASSGEKAIVLGFPAIAAKTYAISETLENQNFKTNTDFVPQPYVTEGIVALVSNKISSEGGVTMAGIAGNIMQLTINSTAEGNSGGPVFNSAGKVIGIFTSIFTAGNARSTGAIPIKYGADLFRSQ